MKRRHEDESLPSPKRPRCNLEHTLSNLSLNSAAPPAPRSPPPAIDAQQPAQPVEDVKMRRSTWYEPEPDRIVVTDLDSSDDDDDGQDTALSISPALIDHIRSRQLVSALPTPATHALVLYRPLPGPTPQKEQAQPQPEPEPPRDDDAMDVEY
ncbi:hypothetical protein IW261DRAFT_1559093 [Armillaria novae-zelandiae]|uniref:Uncharacterized protein n=1 Tax=Armillaria novae-zelandiae TaxID=153914 RepID=A0AA39PJW8_9AGAR|nr:hypothetical protein IW261DRAFT_1559093 [Armillaria novae-zelandiae]